MSAENKRGPAFKESLNPHQRNYLELCEQVAEMALFPVEFLVVPKKNKSLIGPKEKGLDYSPASKYFGAQATAVLDQEAHRQTVKGKTKLNRVFRDMRDSLSDQIDDDKTELAGSQTVLNALNLLALAHDSVRENTLDINDDIVVLAGDLSEALQGIQSEMFIDLDLDSSKRLIINPQLDPSCQMNLLTTAILVHNNPKIFKTDKDVLEIAILPMKHSLSSCSNKKIKLTETWQQVASPGKPFSKKTAEAQSKIVGFTSRPASSRWASGARQGKRGLKSHTN